MNTLSERIEALSTRLLAMAHPAAEDTLEAYGMAHLALLRILDGNPNLDGFPEIMDAVRGAPQRLN